MTFSIVARCARTGQFGMAISSSSPAVAARCAHIRAGVGAVASQNITDPALGPLVLDQMEQVLLAAEQSRSSGRGVAAAPEATTAVAPKPLALISRIMSVSS